MENAFFCHEILQRMCEETKTDRLHSSEMLSALMKQLLLLISREASITRHRSEGALERLCTQLTEYLKTAALTDIDNGVIAKEFGYHPYYLNTVFKKTTGATLHAHIIKRRIEIARELLLSSEMSIAEIGGLCGFSGASYFSECFKTHMGVTPSEYRKRAK
jgi:two-component system response regulator YesN